MPPRPTMLLAALPIAALVALLPVAAAAAPACIEVTRFHLNQPLAGQSVAVVEANAGPATSLEMRAALAAVETELAKAGLAPAPTDGTAAALIATVRIDASQSVVQRRSPISIGIGGGSGGWGGGFGGGVSFPIGGGTRTVTQVTLAIQIRQAADGKAVWEGRASDTVKGGATADAVPRLARALISGFPGPSGETVIVKPKPRPWP